MRHIEKQAIWEMKFASSQRDKRMKYSLLVPVNSLHALTSSNTKCRVIIDNNIAKVAKLAKLMKHLVE